MTGIARNTITKLLVDLGEACMVYHDQHVRNVWVKRLQCDEIWAYVGAKQRNVSVAKKEMVVSRFFRTFQRQRKSEGWSVLGLALDMTP